MDKSAWWKVTFPLTKPKYPKEPSHRDDSFEHPNIWCVAYKNLRKLNTHQLETSAYRKIIFLFYQTTTHVLGAQKNPLTETKLLKPMVCGLLKTSVNLESIYHTPLGAQWLSGRVLDSRPRVWASPASLCCVLQHEHKS